MFAHGCKPNKCVIFDVFGKSGGSGNTSSDMMKNQFSCLQVPEGDLK